MNKIEIERALRELRLCGIAEALCTRMTQAQAAQQPFLETFAATRRTSWTAGPPAALSPDRAPLQANGSG
jgi:hypothetical protein